MTTPMTREEIIRDYRQAANKQYQIGVLADLNLCTKAEIVALLRDAGERVSGNYKDVPAPRTAPAAVPEQQTAEPEAIAAPVEAPAPEEAAAEDEETVTLREALSAVVRIASVSAIARLLHKADRDAANRAEDLMEHPSDVEYFREQVRGVLTLVDEVERRCADTDEEDTEG